MELYLDNAATTPIDARVRAAIEPFLDQEFGNPSSRHPKGVHVADAIARAREQVARALGVRSEAVVFTSGGTEANNLAVLGLARANSRKGKHIVIGATEHPCVRDSARALEREGFEVEVGRLGPDGQPDLEDWSSRLRADTVLVALMLANNELGTIYPVRELAELVRARSPQAKFHTDAVQAFGKLDVRLLELGVDSIAISAHKIHGPKGAGALILAAGVRPTPVVFGGGQEQGLRSGTENVIGCVGLGAAAQLASETRVESYAAMESTYAAFAEAIAQLDDVRLLTPGGSQRLPNIATLQVSGAPAEVYLHHLEQLGVFVSAGSACQAGKKELSPALLALGLTGDEARSILRVSFNKNTTPAEVRDAAKAIAAVAETLGAASR